MSTSLYIRRRTPFPLYEIDMLESSDQQLKEIGRELGIALSQQEMRAV